MPKINQTKDKIVVEQTIDMLIKLDGKILEVSDLPGNSRTFSFVLKRGELHINSTSEEIFVIVSGLSKAYSEPGIDLPNGPVKITTIKNQKEYDVYLKLSYLNKAANITFQGEDKNKKYTSASTSYQLAIRNLGIQTNGGSSVSQINIEQLQ